MNTQLLKDAATELLRGSAVVESSSHKDWLKGLAASLRLAAEMDEEDR